MNLRLLAFGNSEKDDLCMSSNSLPHCVTEPHGTKMQNRQTIFSLPMWKNGPSLLSIVAVAGEWLEAVQSASAIRFYACCVPGWFIMLIVSFPGLQQASLQYCKKGGRGLGMRLIISMNLSVSFEKNLINTKCKVQI